MEVAAAVAPDHPVAALLRIEREVGRSHIPIGIGSRDEKAGGRRGQQEGTQLVVGVEEAAPKVRLMVDGHAGGQDGAEVLVCGLKGIQEAPSLGLLRG